jgi:hypothetical protein
MVAPDRQAPASVVLVGGAMTLLAVGGVVALALAVGTGPLPGDWVLFAVPAVGLLGIAGVGTVLTAYIAR